DSPDPDPLTNASTEEERQAFQKWEKANSMARCYILGSISEVLQKQHEHMLLASEMMLSLKELFGEKDRSVRFELMRKIMSTSMSEGVSVREHVLKMMEYLNEIELFGAFSIMTQRSI
ncbi:retrotransposon gag domain-containing protein, partial [Clostridioides difficile]|nr:retrotransposon gag domain-containing protein [Clostridioides difficile]